MPKLTIAQLREKEVYKLAKLHDPSNPEPSEDAIQEARKLMGSFYRLCGLAERNLYLANDERTCNRPSTKASEDRESAWAARLSKQFLSFAGLELFYSGYAPSIGHIHRPGGGCSEVINRWFYD